jgi:hypothetical protein
MHFNFLMNDGEFCGDMEKFQAAVLDVNIEYGDHGIGHYEFWGHTGVHHDYGFEIDSDAITVSVRLTSDFEEYEDEEDLKEILDFLVEDIEPPSKSSPCDPDACGRRSCGGCSCAGIPDVSYRLTFENVKVNWPERIVSCHIGFEED